MKHLILGFMFLFLTSVATAQTETDWQTLRTMSGTKVSAVKGAKKIDISTAKTLYDGVCHSSMPTDHPIGILLTFPVQLSLRTLKPRS